jgi:hypothetical protein
MFGSGGAGPSTSAAPLPVGRAGGALPQLWKNRRASYSPPLSAARRAPAALGLNFAGAFRSGIGLAFGKR